MKELTKELKDNILCKIDIVFGMNESGHSMVLKKKAICEKYGVKTKLIHETSVWCKDYMILNTDGYLTLNDTEKLIKDLQLNVSINYNKGTFVTNYDNTYW